MTQTPAGSVRRAGERGPAAGRASPARAAAAWAPGRAGVRIPGPGGERSWRRPERRERGRSLARPPRAPSHWPFVLQLCPSPPGSRAAPAPAPRPRRPGKACVPGADPAVRTARAAVWLGKVSRPGGLWQLRPEGRRLRAGRARSPRAGKCWAARRRRGGRGGRGGAPRTSAAAQRRAGSGSPSSVHLPPGLLGTEKWLTAHSCPLLAEERVCLSRRLVLWGETGGGLPGGRGARPPAAEIRVHGRGPCLWLGSHPPSGVLARDGSGACAPAPRHPRWAPSELVWSRPVAWGHPGWAPAARGPAIKLRWIAFEFRTFKFSSSYVSQRGRAPFGAAAPHVTRPSVPVASLAPAPQEEPQEEPSSDVLETPPQARCDPPHGSARRASCSERFGVCQRPPQ